MQAAMDPSPARPTVARPSVLFVCTANVCRSPMAASLFRARLMMGRTDWRNWRVDSAGTWATGGKAAAVGAQQVLARRGMDISMHRSRVVTLDLLRRFQLILTMEKGQKEALLLDYPQFAGRIFMISEMAGQEVDVKDPMGGTYMDFERTADTLDSWISNGLDRIQNLAVPRDE